MEIDSSNERRNKQAVGRSEENQPIKMKRRSIASRKDKNTIQ